MITNSSEMAQNLKASMETAAANGDAHLLSQHIRQYGELHLENSDNPELNNKVVWPVRALLLNWKRDGIYDEEALSLIADALKSITFVTPHRYYSVLMDAVTSLKDGSGNPWIGYVDFAEWWGMENFLPEDFERVRIHNGQIIPSLAERAYTAYVKSLLARLEKGEKREEAEAFLHELDLLAETHPEFRNTGYYKAQILKLLGRNQEAAEAAREFVKRRRHEFWAWSMLGDLVDDDELKFSCYCRALMCKADPAFLVKIRRKAAPMMAARGDYGNARKEYEFVAMTCERHHWHIPEDVQQAMETEWYQTAQPEYNNFNYYRAHSGPAEDFLLGDVPEKAIIIVKYNPQKATCSFITDQRERGFFSTRKMTTQFADNQIYMARLPEGVDTKGPTKVLSLSKVNDVTPFEGIFFRRLRAELNIRPGQTFTFIDDIYVDGTLVQGLQAGDMIDITAVIFYNIKRESWGWRALRVTPAD